MDISIKKMKMKLFFSIIIFNLPSIFVTKHPLNLVGLDPTQLYFWLGLFGGLWDWRLVHSGTRQNVTSTTGLKGPELRARI